MANEENERLKQENAKLFKKLDCQARGVEYVEEIEEAVEEAPVEIKPDEAKLHKNLLFWQNAQRGNDSDPGLRCEEYAAKISRSLAEVKAQLLAAKPPKQRAKELETYIKGGERHEASLK